ncbi:MAG: thiamine pyrophosphate-binding protein [Candidatus Gastranaerophilales bacterium]|nr:thiamine pyrophosphate-binding protein [Candidatus Gastranaerophilales bacterium]
MKIKVADYLAKRIMELGIDTVFGLPGDYNFNILDAIIKNPGVTWINSTNELNASYAADGYARIKGFGAVVTTFGVGELSAINGIAGAYSENVPVLKITGVPKTCFIKANTPLHHNFSNPDYYAFERAFSNVTETTAFLTEENAKDEIDRAFETIVRTRKPVYLALPVDICNHLIEDKIPDIKIKSDERALKLAVEKMSDLINKAKNPLIITDYLMKRFRLQNEVNKFINKFNIKITSMMMGKGLIDEDDPHFIGINYGILADTDFQKAYAETDLVIGFGTLFADLNTLAFSFIPDERFRINIQGNFTEIDGVRYENIYSDDVIKALLNADIIPKTHVENIQKGYEEIETTDNPIKTDEIFPVVQKYLKENDTITVETGIISYPASKMNLKKNSNYISQTMWGSIGWATPASFGAFMADKTKRLILLTGEGSHQLTVQEIANFFKFDVKPIILLLNNKGYTIERVLSNNPDDPFNDITSWDYKKALELFSNRTGRYGANSKDFAYFEAKTSNELNKALLEAQTLQKEKLVYIEIFTEKNDVPILVKQSFDSFKMRCNV